MNWCQPHWDHLRQAISDRGLDGFIAESGEEAAANLKAQLDGEGESFDPLMGSWTRINSEMFAALSKMDREAEALQFPCPMCILVNDGQPELVDDWINSVTDSAKLYAIEQGLVKAN